MTEKSLQNEENNHQDSASSTDAASSKKDKATKEQKKPYIVLASASPRRLELLQKAGVKPEVRVSNTDETLPPELKNQPREAVLYLAQHKVQSVVTELLLEIDESFRKIAEKNLAEGAGPIVTHEDTNESYAKLPYLVIGADTMVVLNGETYGKPRNAQHAKEMLSKLSGNTHVVMTGVSMWYIHEAQEPHAKQEPNGTKTARGAQSAQGTQGAQGAQNTGESHTTEPEAFTPELNIGVVSFVDESEVTFNKLSEEKIDEYVASEECFDKAGAYAAQGKGKALIQQIDGNIDTVIGLPVERMLKDYAGVLGVDAK